MEYFGYDKLHPVDSSDVCRLQTELERFKVMPVHINSIEKNNFNRFYDCVKKIESRKCY
jgi:hypothetical protein